VTEQISGKLPIEHKAPAPLPPAEVSSRLGTAARDWALQISSVADVLADFSRKLSEIADRMRPLVAAEEAISDGAGDDEQA
jgi:hypothetical protein